MAGQPTYEELRLLLDRLDGEPADALEAQHLEFKSWLDADDQPKERLNKVRESVVAFANASGGWLVLGVADRKSTRRDAIQGVGDLSVDRLRLQIYEGTDPAILVDAREIDAPEGRLVALNVPRGIPPHTTTAGVARIRVGKDNKPLTGHDIQQLLVSSGQFDRSAMVVAGANWDDLDPLELDRLRQILGDQRDREELLTMDDECLLAALDLVDDGGVTLAAVLLLGRPEAIAQFAPNHELILLRRKDESSYDLRRDLRRPLLALLTELEQWLEPQRELTIVQQTGFEHREIPNLSNVTVREAALNALVHRDYFLSASTHIELYPDRLEITSPGGFIGGVTPENVLRHQPVRRNSLLADSLLRFGLVNRAGIGVDRIYEELLRAGKDLPTYRTDGLQVSLSLPTSTNSDFTRFVVDLERGGPELSLDQLICLRGVMRYGSMDRSSAAGLLQLADLTTASETLVSLRQLGVLQPVGRGPSTAYQFAPRYRYLGADLADSVSDKLADMDRTRDRVLQALRDSRRLSNAEVRDITGYSRARARRLLIELCDAGLAEARGRGRGAHYVPADSE
jgi:ATP-dependent DNA helicase RecG